MKLVESILTKNPCYTANRKIAVKGLMLHSVGCSQPKASVFINSWNSSSHTASCVHAFIDGNDGTVYQTLPWNHRGWHAGGSANNTHIGVEMCEPACIKYAGGASFTCSDVATAKSVAKRTYDAAVELFAMLCTEFNLNPLADGVIISHSEGAKRNLASGHADPEHLWKGLGLSYTMNTFRSAVSAKMGAKTSITTDNNTEKRIWGFLLGRLGNPYGVAGLMGNLYAESGLNPKNLQNSYNKKLNISDEDYTMVVDANAYKDFVNDKAGYGLAQWTYYSRKQNLLNFAKQRGTSIGDLDMQLEFLMTELKAYKSVYNTLITATSVSEAAIAVLTGFEKPADQGVSVQKKRTEYGQVYFDKYAKVTDVVAPTVPFAVKVTIPDLNIRTGAGTNYAKTGHCTGIGTFTIVEVKAGTGSTKGWGRLKSGAGWISLEYVTKV